METNMETRKANMTVDEMWAAAKDMMMYRYTGKWSDLKFIDMRWAAYGDWYLYRDTDGNYWADYRSIGD